MHLTRGRISACVATYVVYLLLLISVDETCMLCVRGSQKPLRSPTGQDCAKWNNNRPVDREERWGQAGTGSGMAVT